MSVIGGQNIPVTNGLVYALDFKNNKCYVSGSSTLKSIYYDPVTSTVSGSSSFDYTNQNLNIPDALNPASALYGDNDFFIRRNTTFTFQATSSFTIVSNLNVRSAGVLLFQNTDASKFAAHINTSSLEIGFYDPATEYYYTRQYPVNLQTGSNSLIYRYDNGTSDLFINGAPVTSSRNNVPPKALQNTYYSSKVLSYPISSSFNIGIRSRLVDTYRPEFVLAPFGGSLTNFYIYNRALSTNEIYRTYIQLQPAVFRNTSLTRPYTLDENTLLYVSASGISSSAYITAIDAFITGLKSNNIWNKLSAIYPAIGSTTSSQALNLKEPGINRLVYTGSWIASPSGSYPSSSNSYVQLSGFDYPAIATSSAHITYLSYDLPQATASLVAVDKPLSAVGGEIFYSGSKTYHVFRPTGTSSFTVVSPALTSVEVLVVAGGGASEAGYNGGGGGAGGLVYSSSMAITTGNYNIIVGEGGTLASNGRNSSFSTVTAYGGGKGNSGNGGSGGGGGATFNTTGSGGTGSYGDQGKNGGDSVEIYTWGAGGGGGHGSKGETAGVTKTRYASGGSGSYFSQYAGLGLGSPAGWFAGGGGAGGGFALPGNNTTRGPGGIGGGGNGGIESDYGLYNNPPWSGPGIPTASKNTGGGGGGAWYNTGTYGIPAGASGIVIISYNTALATFTSSFGISLSGSNIVGNLHSTTNSGISFDTNASIGLVTVTRTGSTNISIHKDFNSSVITAPVTASILGSVYANASNFAGTVSKVSPYTLSYLSYGAGLSPDEVTTYHNLASKLQYDLGRALLLQGFPAAAAYSVRQISKNYPYAINVRRDFDDVTFDVGFDSLGNLNTGSLLTNMTASGVSTALPGSYSGLAAAYSLRKVSGSYTGSAIDVRRDSDNITGSIGFDSFGNLDTGSLLAFVTGSANTGSGYVAQWYDQSGNARHATQTTTGSQPLMVSSGSIITENNRPAVQFNPLNFITTGLNTSTMPLPQSIIIPVRLNNLASNGFSNSSFYVGGDNSGLGKFELAQNTSGITAQYRVASGISSSAYPFVNTSSIYLQTAVFTTASITTFVNNSTSQSVGPLAQDNYTSNALALGSTNATIANFTFKVPEFFVYSGSLSTTRGLIEDNINGYYNIFTQSLASGSGYVTKWYDQSGNNKHATQTTNAKQPLILRSGSVFLENQKPAILFTGTPTGFSAGTITSTPSDYSIYYVKNAKGGGNPWLIMFGNSSYLTQTYPGNATNFYLQDGAGRTLVGTSATLQTQHVGEIYLNSSNNSDSRAYENNAIQKQGFTTGTYSKVAIPNLLISAWDYGYYTGSAQEIIISTNNHLPVRSSIVSNINSYYRIY